MGEFRVSDKEAKKNSTSAATTITSTSSALGLGSVNKVQQQHISPFKAFPSNKTKTMMMVHHNHHHRPLSSPLDSDSCAVDGDGDGPTTDQYTSLTNHHINAAVSGAVPVPAVLGAAIDGAAAVRRPLQPFDISAYTSATTSTLSAFKSPGGMAASLGFPFTSAQWKELERQAMIYKYMMASVPVPADLLIPPSLTPSASSRSPLDGGFNLRLSSSSNDPEPGRCRRTDGKKWRCSRDVAPNHKYCERHMHRGRPRSRKPVEVHTNTAISSSSSNNNNNSQQQLKRARYDCDPFPASGVTVAISTPTTRKDGSSSHFLAASTTTQPYFESSLSLDNFGVKAANFDTVASVSSCKEPRGLDWMLNGDPISLGACESEWQSLMHNKVGLNAMSSCSNTEPQYLNSIALYSPGLDHHNRRPPMFLNPLVVPMESLQSEKPRGFIDAWSNASTEESNANKKNPVASIGKLSLSSLDLSMGGGYVHEDMGTNEVGLGLMEPDGNTNNGTKTNLSNWLTPAPWVASTTPGGPLAEVLRPSTVTATNDAASNSNPSSPAITYAESSSSPLGTMVSSPSGVLHKTLASLSDSSSNSSPTVASSRTSSEIALLRFNQK